MITNQVILYLTVKHVDTESWNELKCKGKWTNRNVFLIHLKCAIYNIVLSYESFTNTILKVFFVFCIEQWLTTTGVVALAITSTVLGIALLTIFFLLRHVLINQTNRQRSDIPLPQNKKSSQTFTELSTTEDINVYTTLGAREEESSYEVLGESSNT